MINTSVHTELISPITCEYIVLFKMCELRNKLPYAPCWYDVLVTAQGNSSIISNLRKHNKTILTLHFINEPKKHNSFISPHVNTTVNNSSITEANYNTQTRSFISNTVSRTNVIVCLNHNNRSSFIYLVYAKRSIHERIRS